MHERLRERIAAEIDRLLAEREGTATICPSEVARSLRPDQWRGLMEDVRSVAAGEAQAGRLEVTRGGERVDPLEPGGPIRLGRP